MRSLLLSVPVGLLLMAGSVVLAAGPGPASPVGATSSPQAAEARAQVIRAATLLDGAGNTLHDRDIVIRDGTIEDVLPAGEGEGTVYALDGLTVLPGLIDTHVHIGWHFDRTGRIQSSDVEETPEEAILYAMENAWVTLRGGVTTVQSLGSPSDAELRDAFARGVLPGPRILTSLQAVGAWVGEPEELEARVRELAERGADAIKVFASASIRDGGTPTLSEEQLRAICGTAGELGLRSVIHAHGPESARRAAVADCTTIEHGALLDRETLEVMAAHDMFFDPNIDLVFRNYFENKERFLGVGNYTEEGFARMEAALEPALAAFREALTVPGLRVVFGTDAVAGAHGRNVQELIYRVEVGGQAPMDGIVSATSLAAESLGLSDRIGTIAPGMAADVIATAGNPAVDIGALERVRFVMSAGRVIRHDGVPME